MIYSGNVRADPLEPLNPIFAAAITDIVNFKMLLKSEKTLQDILQERIIVVDLVCYIFP